MEKTKDSEFFLDLQKALLEAIEMGKGTIPMVPVEGMPAKSYRASSVENSEGNDSRDP